MESYSAIKKDKQMPFAEAWLELETLIPSEVWKRKDTSHMVSHLCGIKNRAQMNLSTQQKQILDMEGRLVFSRGGGGREGHWQGIWGWWTQTISFRMDDWGCPAVPHRGQHLVSWVRTWWEMKKKNGCRWVAGSLYCTAKIEGRLQIKYTWRIFFKVGFCQFGIKPPIHPSP